MTLLLIIVFSVLGSLGSVALAAGLLLFKDSVRQKLIPYLVSYAVGTLLAMALVGLIPEAVERLEIKAVALAVLLGIVAFFVLEKLVIWRHCHEEDCQRHQTSAYLLMVGDGFHNFLDGIVIASSFLISISLGIIVSLSVIAHEIPQELGDFAILLKSGFSRAKALWFNSLSGLTTLVGAGLGYFVLPKLLGLTPYIMAVSAASFIYIALADLFPELHHKPGLKDSFKQVSLIILGIVTILLLAQFHHD